jgi:hypothetical protein
VIVSTGAYFHISARIDFAAKGSKYDENIPVTGHIKFEYMLYLKKKNSFVTHFSRILHHLFGGNIEGNNLLCFNINDGVKAVFGRVTRRIKLNTNK